jgi:signal transduction histidine kinase
LADLLRRARSDLTPWVVLAIGLGLTLLIGVFFLIYASQRDNLRFENAVQSANDNIISRLDVYRTAVRGGAALFAASEDVSREAFRRYVQRMDLQARYPGVQGLGFSRRISYTPGDTIDERHRIEFLEPMDERNAAAIGYDMYSEPTRRSAMATARDSGRQAMSGRVVLVQEIIGPVQAGFLIYSPVYRGGRIPPTVAERREKLIGFVYSPFRADDLFRGIFGSEAQPRVSFSVYDGTAIDSTRLLHASPRASQHEPAFTRVNTLTIANHTWTVTYASEPAFEKGSTAKLWFAVFVIAGVIASFWLFLLSRAQSRARRIAEEASQAKSSFLAVMSHELRTPLNAIGGYVDLMLLRVGGPVNEQQEQYLERIRHAQRHLLGLINSVLNYSKLQSQGVEYRLECVRLHDVMKDVEVLITPQVAAAGLRYHNRGGPDTEVFADSEKLRQILLNLLSNAIKFTPQGEVRIGWTCDETWAHIDCTDTGIGIAPDRLAHIFDPFVQIDADLTRTRQGTGLGLSIARELARGMGGDLKASSSVGRGSTFTLILPRPNRAQQSVNR